MSIATASVGITPAVTLEKSDPYKDERTGKVREVGGQAVWSLSSCKPGWCSTVALRILLS